MPEHTEVATEYLFLCTPPTRMLHIGGQHEQPLSTEGRALAMTARADMGATHVAPTALGYCDTSRASKEALGVVLRNEDWVEQTSNLLHALPELDGMSHGRADAVAYTMRHIGRDPSLAALLQQVDPQEVKKYAQHAACTLVDRADRASRGLSGWNHRVLIVARMPFLTAIACELLAVQQQEARNTLTRLIVHPGDRFWVKPLTAREAADARSAAATPIPMG